MVDTVLKTIRIVSEFNANPAGVKQATQSFGTLGHAVTRLRIAYFNLAVLSGFVVGGLGKVAKESEKTRFEIQRLAITSQESFGKVTDSINNVRSKTNASNKELITSFQELAKSGFNLVEQQDILTASSGAALVGFSSLQETADATSQTLRQFGIASSEAGDVAYKLAAVANAGKVDIGNLGQALKFAGAIAYQTGTPLEELSSTIAILSNKGLSITQIGRGIRQSLLSLVSPSEQARSIMKAYGINITETDGSMKSFIEIIQELDTQLTNLSASEKQDVLGRIFPANSISIVLELLDSTTINSIKELSDNMDSLADEERFNAIKLQQETVFTWGKAWETVKLQSEETISNMVDGIAPVEDMTGAIADLRGELIKIAKAKGMNNLVKELEGVTSSGTTIGGSEADIFSTPSEVYTQRQVAYLEGVRKEFAKMGAPIINSLFTPNALLGNNGVQNYDLNKLNIAPTIPSASNGKNLPIGDINAYSDVLNDSYSDAVRLSEDFFNKQEEIISSVEDEGKQRLLLNALAEEYGEQLKSSSEYSDETLQIWKELTKQIGDAVNSARDFSSIMLPAVKKLGLSEYLNGGTLEGVQAELTKGKDIERVVVNDPHFDSETIIENRKKLAKAGMNDFVMRPGSPAVSFSPEDTIIGVKNPSNILNNNQRVNANIIINGSTSPQATAQEVATKIKSLA